MSYLPSGSAQFYFQSVVRLPVIGVIRMTSLTRVDTECQWVHGDKARYWSLLIPDSSVQHVIIAESDQRFTSVCRSDSGSTAGTCDKWNKQAWNPCRFHKHGMLQTAEQIPRTLTELLELQVFSRCKDNMSLSSIYYWQTTSTYNQSYVVCQ